VNPLGCAIAIPVLAELCFWGEDIRSPYMMTRSGGVINGLHT
jgi:hypothetical protein